MDKNNVSKPALIAILMLAAFLRLWNLGATEFKYDEARVCMLAAHFLDTGIPPVRGMGSSTGIDNPPLTIYLISLPVLLSRDPLVATAFVAVANVVGVWGCYALGKRYWGPQVGLLAALLWAVSPWAIFYSRKVWAQDLLPPWVLLFFACLLAWWVDGKAWALGAAIVTLAALTQIHFAAVSLVPLFAIVLVAGFVERAIHRQLGTLWKPLAIGLGIGLLLYAPYIVYDAMIGWRNVRALIALVQAPAQTQWEVLRFALLNIGGREIHALAGSDQFRRFLGGILDLAYWPDRTEEIAVVASIAYLPLRRWATRLKGTWRQDGVLLLWLLVPVLFFVRTKSTVFPHYLIPLYPAPYLTLGIGVMDLFRALARWRRIHSMARLAGTALLCGLVLWQSYLSLSIHAFVDQADTPGGMGTPIRILRDVVRTMQEYARTWQNSEIVMLCTGDDPRWHECPAVFGFMTSRSLDVRFVDGSASLLFPESQRDTLIVVAPEQSVAADRLSTHARELAQTAIPLREERGTYRFYQLPAGYVPLPPQTPADTPTRLANGVSLTGYALAPEPAPGRVSHLALYWHIDAVPTEIPAQGYSFANHLIASDGRRYGQKDGPGYPASLWHKGDSLISWFDIDLASEAYPAPYHLRIGMYVYTPPDHFDAISIVDANDQPIADAVEWPLD